MASHIYSYLKANNLISKHQSGFIPGDSTVFQLISFSDYLHRALDNGQEVFSVFMDISKAFDRVWHSGLLVKLKSYGFDASFVSFFKSYLSGREQRVSFMGSLSNSVIITAGVPQGSVLGPVLFLLFINDIVDDLESKAMLFADDTSLSKIFDRNTIVNLVTTINNDLRLIEKWAKSWLVNFNPDKTQIMVFSLKREQLIIPDFFFFGKRLVVVDSHTHLGVTFQSKLKWDNHVESLLIKAQKRLNIMRRIKFTVPRKSLQTIYISMIRSLLDYACISVHWDVKGTV